ncbi:MAG: hypothetical protein OEX03_07500 [Gammaproteobacteria bacterium]|nr:hypothetical protein [Gammaproteobacteria bacterium]
MNETLYNELIRLAQAQDLAAYSDVAPIIELSMDNEEDRNRIAELLREIAIHENSEGRPMLTALIVHRGNDNKPGEGFFSIAQELGHFDGIRGQINMLTFWSNQVTQVHNHWASA